MENASFKILIVEDDLILSYVLEKYIRELGHELVGAVTKGHKAIEKAKSDQPDVILMDIKLVGDIDGIEAMRRINEYTTIPVIYITGNSDHYNRQRAREIGYVDYLIKPITIKDLKKSLQSVGAETN